MSSFDDALAVVASTLYGEEVTPEPPAVSTRKEPTADAEPSQPAEAARSVGSRLAGLTSEVVDDPRASALDKTDHQEAVQDLTGVSPRSRGSGGSGSESDLVQALLSPTSFKVNGDKPGGRVKDVPSLLIDLLRDRLELLAERELGLTAEQSSRIASLGQTTVVVGFLAAQLDVRLDLDPTTAVVQRLFQRMDPLLGSVVDRMDELERSERETTGAMLRVNDRLVELDKIAGILEHLMAWLMTDRVESLSQVTSIDKVSLGHSRVIKMRDLAREQMRRQRRDEDRRDGRPIR